MRALESAARRTERDRATRLGIADLYDLETEYAYAEHGRYHSPAEGLAVIMEEMHETRAEMDEADGLLNELAENVFTRKGDFTTMRCVSTKLASAAMRIMTEALHVAAAAGKLVECINAKQTKYFRPQADDAAETKRAVKDGSPTAP